MMQTEQCSETACLDEPPPDMPHALRILTVFEDLYDILKVFEPVGNGLNTGALKRGTFRVRFYKWNNPFSRREEETGMHEYRLMVETENCPFKTNPYCITHAGSWEGVEQGIKDDIRYLNSLGIRKVKYLGYQGEMCP